ncbi:MAG: hypothetical protein AMXMBFR36_22560 [Acidobacteriota bacterium]
MSGERDLARLLAGLAPELDPRPQVFAKLAGEPGPELVAAAFAVVREREGVTVVLAADIAGQFSLPVEPLWAKVTLSIHSDLAAVGMMAAVAAELAAAGIAVNPLAGWHHDHLLVPWDRREEAVRRLAALANRAAATR